MSKSLLETTLIYDTKKMTEAFYVESQIIEFYLSDLHKTLKQARRI